MLPFGLDRYLYYYDMGGFVMPVLVFTALLLWYALGYRYHTLHRGAGGSVRDIFRKRDKKKKPAKGILDAAAMKGSEILANNGVRHLRDHLDEAFYHYEQDIRKYSTTIKTLVAIAPLLGLLGTVDGMIETFNSLGDMTLFSQSGGIAGGISKALFTTQMGLVIAIPGLLIGRFLEKKEQMIFRELNQLKDLICTQANERS